MLDDGTEVYPDLLVLKPRQEGYREPNHTGGDVLLVNEAGDSSLPLDLTDKLA